MRREAYFDGLRQKVPALGALVEAEDGLACVVVCQVAIGNGGSSVNLQPVTCLKTCMVPEHAADSL